MSDLDRADPPYPTYDDFRQQQTLAIRSKEAARLVWSLDGPLNSGALQVMGENCNPDEPFEPYFQQTPSGTRWHPIADMPLTQQKISLIRVTTRKFSNRIDNWEEYHIHAEPGMPGCIFGDAKEDDVEPPLLRCCGQDRPQETIPVIVRPSSKPYVTVHDYVAAVHPWLLSVKDKLRRAMNVYEDGEIALDTRLMVCGQGRDEVYIKDLEGWKFNGMRHFRCMQRYV